MFPPGTAGAGLLVLRVFVAATLIASGTAHWALTPPPLITLGLALLAISLCLGIFTPYCATAACLIQAYLLVLVSGTDEFHLAIAILNSVVLALLGPGAYSGDARIFGRKRLTLPSRRKSHL
jgi:uncharacterized membrane protein YphA (DoxX/SURF4 family)